jgi:hypothetical protein
VSGYERLARVCTFAPLSSAEAVRSGGGSYRACPFRAPWARTVDLLAHELRALRPNTRPGAPPFRAILELALQPGDFRLDGVPRANARAAHPGVVLVVAGSRYGDLRYPCSTFADWQDNVRAIALALEALRKVDRYGVTKRGEQYAGWLALPAGNGASPDRGREIVQRYGSEGAALRATHPDTRSGEHDDSDFESVQMYRGMR